MTDSVHVAEAVFVGRYANTGLEGRSNRSQGDRKRLGDAKASVHIAPRASRNGNPMAWVPRFFHSRAERFNLVLAPGLGC